MTTAFVLSGGGSLGAVQVGMLQALEDLGVEPDLLIGTSAGALNAAYLAGHGMSYRSMSDLAEIWRGLPLVRHPIDRAVNSVRNDGPQIIEAVALEAIRST